MNKKGFIRRYGVMFYTGRDSLADIKLIATDLDGTFMSDALTPHPQNVESLLKCKAHGIAFCICTGRNWHGIKDLVAKVPFDRYCVINNGSSIYDSETNTLRYRNRFDPEIAREILMLCTEFEGAHIGASTTFHTHVIEERLPDKLHKRWLERAKSNPEWADSLFMHKDVDELVLACQDDMQRISLGLNIQDADMLNLAFTKIGAIAGVELTTSGFGSLEISPKDGTKAEALSVLADIYEVEPQNVLAFGDNYNDMHMLLWAGTGVAMGNADHRLKSIADYVTDTNVDAGVSRAIERIVFHNEVF